MESVEAAAIGNELGTLFLEDLPDRSVGPFSMGMRLGPGDAFVHQPGVQLVIALDTQARREEALAHEADLVLDLALLPARRWRAGDGLDKMVRAHLEEAAIVLPILADEDRLHRRLHVVVDAARAGAPEEREGPLVGVEHHLLRLAWIGAREHHAAVAGNCEAAYDRQDFAEALRLCRPLAEQGDPKPQAVLGLMYMRGAGVQ